MCRDHSVDISDNGTEAHLILCSKHADQISPDSIVYTDNVIMCDCDLCDLCEYPTYANETVIVSLVDFLESCLSHTEVNQ
jgi:hypothetical protein